MNKDKRVEDTCWKTAMVCLTLEECQKRFKNSVVCTRSGLYLKAVIPFGEISLKASITLEENMTNCIPSHAVGENIKTKLSVSLKPRLEEKI